MRGFCVEGVCCDTACTGTCNACSLAKTGVRNGSCAPVKAGIDPDQECATESPQSCGKTGMCNGQSACGVYADGTSCGTSCCSGAKGRAAPCTFVCRAGRCDKEQPVIEDTCAGFGCCCPNGDGPGQSACTPYGDCQAGCTY